jgi:histidine triad (HIT) family protein
MSECIFCRIIAGEIPCQKIAETDDWLAFHDIRPAAPIHFLVIPKRHIASLADSTPEDVLLLGTLLVAANQLAQQLGLAQGYRTVINTGVNGGQEVYHLHLHVLGNPIGKVPATTL